MKNYDTEREGQIAFYEKFMPRVDPSADLSEILQDNNDGVVNGCLLEFKLNISDLNAVLFQSIKYLSALRIKGKPVPAHMLLVDLDAESAYLYDSAPYLEFIEEPYSGGASKNDKGFSGGPCRARICYGSQEGAEELVAILKLKDHIKIHIDENCIVGWARAFYAAVPSARKEDFIGDETGAHKTLGEIRNPAVFKDYLIPYTGKSNIRFQYLMDKLNDTIQKKNLGAFYTPAGYAKKSHELLMQAIARVPQGNDYVIIDRCAGTGNLEKGLPPEVLEHCILSTVEYYEYKLLLEILGSKVRCIIPPVEAEDTFSAGLVKGADALSRDYVENPIMRRCIDDPKCTVILFENPPYAETTSIEHQKKKAGAASSTWKKSYVMQEMRNGNVTGTALNDLGNLFIWSAFRFYLRQPTDSYVVYSPVKYWKAQHLISRKFINGFAFNRKAFHTNIDACIMCALWSQESAEPEILPIRAYDMDKEGRLIDEGSLEVKKVHKSFSQVLYDKRSFSDDKHGGIFAEFDGTESPAGRSSVRIRPLSNANIVGYLAVKGANFDNPDSSVHLLRVGAYDANGFYLRSDNFMQMLPMFCASRYITYNRKWTERGRIMKSADGATRFLADLAAGKLEGFLAKCLIFTCLEMQNHCRSFTGSDGKFYRNELALDGTNGPTLAMKRLKEAPLDEADEKILDEWNRVLNAARVCPEYDPSLTYGLYQIFSEIDTSTEDPETGNRVWNNLELHSSLQTLKQKIREYYNAEITETLFNYEFLK